MVSRRSALEIAGLGTLGVAIGYSGLALLRQETAVCGRLNAALHDTDGIAVTATFHRAGNELVMDCTCEIPPLSGVQTISVGFPAVEREDIQDTDGVDSFDGDVASVPIVNNRPTTFRMNIEVPDRYITVRNDRHLFATTPLLMITTTDGFVGTLECAPAVPFRYEAAVSDPGVAQGFYVLLGDYKTTRVTTATRTFKLVYEPSLRKIRQTVPQIRRLLTGSESILSVAPQRAAGHFDHKFHSVYDDKVVAAESPFPIFFLNDYPVNTGGKSYPGVPGFSINTRDIDAITKTQPDGFAAVKRRLFYLAIVHEFVHTKQTFVTTTATKWLLEGLATYYMNVVLYNIARRSEELSISTGGLFDQVDTDGHTDVVLTDPTTWSPNSDQAKGEIVLAGLEKRLRERTHHERTVVDLFRRLNTHAGDLSQSALLGHVAAVGDPEIREWFERTITTTFLPEIPTEDSYFQYETA